MKKSRLLVVLLTVVLFESASLAVDVDSNLFTLSLEDLMAVQVVTSSRRAESIDAAPNVMYVVTRQQILQRGYRTLQDVLQTIPGFAVFHRDLQFVAQVRGVAPNENEKVTFMLNGHSINQVTEPEILVGPLNLDLVERIEVIVGPGSVLYGADSLCAIVNIVTRSVNGREVMVSAGSDGLLSATAMVGEQWGAARKLTAGFTWMRRDGWDAWSEAARPDLAGTDVTGQLDPSSVLLVTGEWDAWWLQFFVYNGAMPELNVLEQPNVDSALREDYMTSFVLRHTRSLSDIWEGMFEVSYDDRRLLRATTAGEGSGHDLAQETFRVEHAWRRQGERNYFQAGVQVGFSANRHNYNFRWSPDNTAYDGSSIQALTAREDTQAYGVYVSDELQLHERVRLVLAGRADVNTMLEDDDVFFSPRLALVTQPHARWTSKLMYNTSTRMPSPWASPLNKLWGEQNQAPSYFINSTAEDPETLETYEWQNIVYVGASRFSLNLYHQTLHDFIAWFRPFTNAGDFDGSGAELEFRTPLSTRATLWGNAAYHDAEFDQTALSPPVPVISANDRGEMAAVAKYTATLGVDLDLARNFGGNLTLRYFTRQPAYFADQEAWGYVDDQIYLDASVAWMELRGTPVDLMLSGRNLLDNREEVAAQFHSYTYQPRGATVELTAVYHY